MKQRQLVATLACLAFTGSVWSFSGSYVGLGISYETLDTHSKPHNESGVSIPVEPDNNLPVEPRANHQTASNLASIVTNQANAQARGAGLELIAGFGHVFDNQWYAGAEVHVGISKAKDNTSKQVTDDTLATSRVESTYHYGAMGRFGYVIDESTLVFVKAGLERRHFKTTSDIARYGKRSDSQTLLGLVIGGGVEHKVSQSTSLRVDYSYAQYDKGDLFKSNPSGHRVMAGFNVYL